MCKQVYRYLFYFGRVLSISGLHGIVVILLWWNMTVNIGTFDIDAVYWHIQTTSQDQIGYTVHVIVCVLFFYL